MTGRWVNVAMIQAARPDLSTSHVYKLASVHGWRRHREGRAVWYCWDDVCATLAGED